MTPTEEAVDAGIVTLQDVRRVCTQRATVDLQYAASIFGIGMATAYRLAKYQPEGLPFKVLRVGSRYKIPTSSILESLDEGAEAPLTA